MQRKINLVISIITVIVAVICAIFCFVHYGTGVSAYYEEKFEALPVVEDIYLLDEGTVIEQLFTNEDPYFMGVDLLMINTGEGFPGTLIVQLCDHEGNVLAQKKEEISAIAPGQFYTVQFLEPVDIGEHEYLYIRLLSEGNEETVSLVAISSLEDVEDSIGCTVDGGSVEHNLAIMYMYGKEEYVGYTWKTTGEIETLLACLVLITIIAFSIIYFVYNRDKLDLRKCVDCVGDGTFFKQILAVVWFFFVFLFAAVISQIRNGRDIPGWVYFYLIGTLILTEICYCYIQIQKFKKRKKRRRIKRNISVTQQNVSKKRRPVRRKTQKSPVEVLLQDQGLLIVILCSVLMRLPLFLNIQMWDGSIYYGCIQAMCKEFDFSLAFIWNNFRIANHYSLAFSFFVAIGEFLFPDNMTGVLLVMLILTEAALVCIYKMLREYWLDLSQWEATIVTVLISVCPLFLGLFSNVSLDNLLIVFVIFLLYAEYKEQTVMKIVWLAAVMMTKETGLVIVAGYLLVHIGKRLWETVKYQRSGRLQYFLSDIYVLCGIGAALVLCFYVIKQGGLFVWMGMNEKNNEENVFVMYLKNFLGSWPLIRQKLKLIFVLHYQWIPTAVTIGCLIYRRRRKWSSFKFRGQGSFYGTLGIFVLLNIFLVHYALARYHIFSSVMLWILAVIILFDTFRECLENRKVLVATMVTMVLVFLQNFYYIDPITNLLFDRYDTGKGKMIATEYEGGNLGDGFVNNFRHTYLYGLADTMLEESGFASGTYLIIPYEKDYLPIHHYTKYDTEEKQRVFSAKADGRKVVNIGYMFLDELIRDDSIVPPQKGIMYILPYIDVDEQECIERAKLLYDVGERKEISNWGGSLVYYELQRK